MLEARLQALVVPSTAPVQGEVGSGFGVRPDPITGRNALHSGLDFPAEPGTPVRAAAGGGVHASMNDDNGAALRVDPTAVMIDSLNREAEKAKRGNQP